MYTSREEVRYIKSDLRKHQPSQPDASPMEFGLRARVAAGSQMREIGHFRYLAEQNVTREY
jgi:hypothetical protein